MNKKIEIPEGYEARIEGNRVIIELKQSEDERIRKELYEYFHNLQLRSDSDFSPSFTIDDVLAYLERQKYKMTAEEYEKSELFQLKLKTKYSDGYQDALVRNQNHEEWSEEDEEKIDDIIRIICDTKECSKIANIGEEKEDNSAFYDDLVLFLKSTRPQTKQEWSQDDNDFADDAIACVTRCYEKYMDNKVFYQSLHHNTMDIKRWLIKVRKRLTPQWKPSKEQMKHLSAAIEESNNNPVLESLYHDLQKLF